MPIISQSELLSVISESLIQMNQVRLKLCHLALSGNPPDANDVALASAAVDACYKTVESCLVFAATTQTETVETVPVH